MSQACPINYTVVDSTVGRVASFLTALAVSGFLFSGEPLILILLGADLMIRLYGDKHHSAVYQLSVFLKRLFKLPSRNVDGAAKQVAGYFGLLLIVLLLLFSYTGFDRIVAAVGGIYIACLVLDIGFNYCLGCKAYYIYRLFR